MIILIPSYQPGPALVDLVDALAGARVLVVDDGSGPDYAAVFDAVQACGATVLRHAENRGKGAALKTGFAYVHDTAPGESVVCADSDGQHRPDDIAAVAAEVARGHASIVLGARGFDGAVPLRSQFGNDVTRVLFGALTGRRLADTQTGLRGYPASLLPWLMQVPGERFAYEQQVLLEAVAQGLTIREVPIATVYLQANASSHFRPVRDSWAIYQPLLRHVGRRLGPFTLSSLAGWVVDLSVFALLTLTGLGAVAAQLAARPLSAVVNFGLNRHWVFRGRTLPPLPGAVGRYLALAAANLTAGAVLLHLLVSAGVWALPAKVACDIALFLAGYLVQRHWWGRRTSPGPRPEVRLRWASADGGVGRLVDDVDVGAARVGVDRPVAPGDLRRLLHHGEPRRQAGVEVGHLVDRERRSGRPGGVARIEHHVGLGARKGQGDCGVALPPELGAPEGIPVERQ